MIHPGRSGKNHDASNPLFLSLVRHLQSTQRLVLQLCLFPTWRSCTACERYGWNSVTEVNQEEIDKR